ncbi:MAG: hypothetical protein Tsb0013_06210 [Phycisphaerales bacterium]
MEKIMKTSICALMVSASAGLAVAGNPIGPDVQVCRLYSVTQYERDGQLNGLSVGTTSYNAGDENLDWYASPNENHPFIAYNLFRMNTRRVEQVGVSWIKHGFFATNFPDCNSGSVFPHTGCAGGGGSELKPACGDTYGAGLNASLSYLGPRYEVNPWTGQWDYTGSLFDNGIGNGLDSPVDRLMMIHDDDLDPSMNPGMTYWAEGYYVAADDVNHMNSASYRPVGLPTWTGSSWAISSPSTVSPTIGFVFQEWGGNESLVTQDGNVPQEFVSGDGRCILSAKVFDNGDGTWDYEYALYNVDMDAQVKTFEVPIPAGVNIIWDEFHAPFHDEDMNATINDRGVPIDNTPWTSTLANGVLKWETDSNPIRWGMMFNFRFRADAPPTTGTIDIDPFRGTNAPGEYETQNFVPMPVMVSLCDGDFDGDGDVDLGDFGVFGSAFGSMTGDANYDPNADFDNDGDVDLGDFGIFGGEFGRTDC